MNTFNATLITRKWALLLAAVFVGPNAMAQGIGLSTKSPVHRVALVELYSSEGCNSCPPADAWLAKIGSEVSPELVVPLALHVDYWDSLGWKDRFGDHAFTLRQRALADYANSKVVYTPEVFAGGRELRRWNTPGEARNVLQQITSQISSVDIGIKVTSNAANGAGSYKLTARATNNASGDSKQPQNAYIAVYQNKLVSKVAAGENGGVTLHHEYVVRRWLGPFALKGGTVTIQQNIALDSFGGDIPANQFGIVTFVQNATTGEVQQVARLALGR
ncbi:thioredoxin family protein [Glaciimonas sp. PAMC28666]|uniref:DUF1223 domain-containing protein n=1 Tax=Glaciimonas sp. PAMC28666 TaxID=2807626 RepID=UPI001F049183|nr:DUF1223 domain-containing protein [Glaciimonas sp. PAMC28666]